MERRRGHGEAEEFSYLRSLLFGERLSDAFFRSALTLEAGRLLGCAKFLWVVVTDLVIRQKVQTSWKLGCPGGAQVGGHPA